MTVKEKEMRLNELLRNLVAAHPENELYPAELKNSNNKLKEMERTMTTKGFASKHGIKSVSEWADSNPNMAENWEANHYKVTLRAKGKQLTTYFSKGFGLSGEPTAAEVLDCLASDAAGYENARDFEDWASDYGYDTDSRKAEKLYRVIGKQAEKLKKFLGDNYEALLWNTERD